MKTKQIFLVAIMMAVSFNLVAQDEEEVKTGFQKDKLFTGGTLNLSFGNQVTALGLSPFFGYSLNKYLDVAASVGVSYISQRDYSFYNADDKLRQVIYGPGAFVRVFPVKFLFAQAQYEFNLIKLKYIPPSNSGLPSDTYNSDAHSVLVGGGFASGRDAYNKSFYYISVLWDVAKSDNSPYKDNLNRAIPILRAGYNIALFQGK
ncbi:MAG: hypothetical protein H7X88_03560 [Gloeobacteraceae cyanobacterium ES-bin-316]|nr:hypothetical protein [Ferruginibacter sp.]